MVQAEAAAAIGSESNPTLTAGTDGKEHSHEPTHHTWLYNRNTSVSPSNLESTPTSPPSPTTYPSVFLTRKHTPPPRKFIRLGPWVCKYYLGAVRSGEVMYDKGKGRRLLARSSVAQTQSIPWIRLALKPREKAIHSNITNFTIYLHIEN